MKNNRLELNDDQYHDALELQAIYEEMYYAGREHDNPKQFINF